MSDNRHTIQFAYQLMPPPSDQASHLVAEAFRELSAWRSILHKLELFGTDDERNIYGNISIRLSDEQFVITVQDSGVLDTLPQDHWVQITDCNLDRCWVDALGSLPPCSDTLTHGAAYQADHRIHCVLSVHSAEIWRHAEALNLPQTLSPGDFGAPAAARDTISLIDQYQSRPLLLCASAQGAVLVCGNNVRDCASLLVHTLAKVRTHHS